MYSLVMVFSAVFVDLVLSNRIEINLLLGFVSISVWVLFKIILHCVILDCNLIICSAHRSQSTEKDVGTICTLFHS